MEIDCIAQHPGLWQIRKVFRETRIFHGEALEKVIQDLEYNDTKNFKSTARTIGPFYWTKDIKEQLKI